MAAARAASARDCSVCRRVTRWVMVERVLVTRVGREDLGEWCRSRVRKSVRAVRRLVRRVAEERAFEVSVSPGMGLVDGTMGRGARGAGFLRS